MGQVTRLRCPACGMLVTIGHLERFVFHPIEVVKQVIGGRGKIGKAVKVESHGPDSMLDFWIDRLEALLDHLKLERDTLRYERGVERIVEHERSEREYEYLRGERSYEVVNG